MSLFSRRPKGARTEVGDPLAQVIEKLLVQFDERWTDAATRMPQSLPDGSPFDMTAKVQALRDVLPGLVRAIDNPAPELSAIILVMAMLQEMDKPMDQAPAERIFAARQSMASRGASIDLEAFSGVTALMFEYKKQRGLLDL